MINRVAASGPQALFTATNLDPRFHTLRLWAQGVAGSTALTVLINGEGVPLTDGFTVNANPSEPRQKSASVLLNNGDIVSLNVEGAPANFAFSRSLDPDEI